MTRYSSRTQPSTDCGRQAGDYVKIFIIWRQRQRRYTSSDN